MKSAVTLRMLHETCILTHLLASLLLNSFRILYFSEKYVTYNFPAENIINLPELYKFHIRQLYNVVYFHNTPNNAHF